MVADNRRYKQEHNDIVISASFFVAICVYCITRNINLSSAVFVLCLSFAIFNVTFKAWRKRKKLMYSGILEIDKMPGEQFEEFILVHFKALGYTGYITRGSHDYGADIVIGKKGLRKVVQAKRWSQKVSVDAVQQIAAAVRHYKAHKALVITN